MAGLASTKVSLSKVFPSSSEKEHTQHEHSAKAVGEERGAFLPLAVEVLVYDFCESIPSHHESLLVLIVVIRKLHLANIPFLQSKKELKKRE
jgi:hypothetical protein